MASRKARTRHGRKDVRLSASARRKTEAARRLVDYIEGERRRLMRATSVLDMMRIAMEEIESRTEFTSGDPCLSDVTANRA